MARRRIWRNKPEAEKERRRARIKDQGLRGKGQEINPEIKARYRALSPGMKETVDGMLALGIGLDQVMRGLE